MLNRGVAVSRYGGGGGKFGSSEAGVELLATIRENVERKLFQMEEMGAMENGGGGTTAKFLAQQLSAHVADVGVGVMNMHSPFEVIGIADLWAATQFY